jgi:sulfite exporter TauE/SafE
MMNMIDPKFISAFIMGLMSSVHCFGMCGGISAAFGVSTTQQSTIQRLSRLFAYNTGRITCYVLLGALFGGFSQFFTAQFHLLMMPLRVFAGLMLIAMACYVAQWWMGITVFEQAGKGLWKIVQPFTLTLMPVDRISTAYLFGLLWGLLPCGLIYGMLVWTSASGGAPTAALLMLGFGLGTLPAMVATGFGAAQFNAVFQNRQLRLFSALLLMAFGIWTIGSALRHGH